MKTAIPPTATLMTALLLLCSSTVAMSQVQHPMLLQKVLWELDVSKNNVDIYLIREQALPEARTLYVIPVYETTEKDELGHTFQEWNAYIAIADDHTGQVHCKYYENRAWTSDAIQLTDITIDTGLYVLNGHTAAIGVRVSYTGSSRPNPYHATDLSLFVPENGELKQILRNFRIATFSGEWDTRCRGAFEDSHSEITTGNSKTGAWYDLIIRTQITQTRNLPVNNDCVEKTKTSRKTRKLHYNGNNYQ